MTPALGEQTLSKHAGQRILVTGSAGFVGFHLAQRLLQGGANVLGVDNFSPYYDVQLKEERTALLARYSGFDLARISIEDRDAFSESWSAFAPTIVVHLAAQAGVRYSIDHPEAYVSANLIGTFNVLELARRSSLTHLLAASTSSIYGANTAMPFAETQRTATPLTLYAATKGASELMGHSYANIFRVPTTFFRFFSVYGPWGRPDMALFKFAQAMLRGEPIEVYNNGDMVRDFTYVADLVEAIVRLIGVPPNERVENDSLSPVAPFRIVNIGGGAPAPLMDYIRELEQALGITAHKTFLPMQIGDVPATEASTELLRRLINFVPSTPISVGVPAFARWYRDYFERQAGGGS